MVFENSKWIWHNNAVCDDDYAEFVFTVPGIHSGAYINISCDSNYALYINRDLVASGQYGDFPHYKIYDTLFIGDKLTSDENEVMIVVHHTGTPTSRYFPADAGLIFEIYEKDNILISSSASIKSRRSINYASGRCVLVSSQLGYGFSYNGAADSNDGFAPSLEVAKKCEFYARPIKKAIHTERKEMKSITRISDTRYLIDLGEECVGLPSLNVRSQVEQTLKIAWGEHIIDGGVRYVIGNRNFYYEYKTAVGENSFVEPMLRIACRYLEVFSEEPIDIEYVGVIPEIYPIEAERAQLDTELHQKIYDISLNTLKLCMMEHYVDCPWREQALYAFDSRNQMLAGYIAFKGGNKEYARANLKLIGMDKRSDGLLNICAPAGSELAIPSFSLYYFISMYEYIKYTSDTSLAAELYPKLTTILDAFFKNMRDGLVCRFEGKNYWNFYDWSSFSEGRIRVSEDMVPDLAINCLFVMALDAFEKISSYVSKEFEYAGIKEAIKQRINEEFLTDDGIYTMKRNEEQYTVLGNALAILSGVAGDRAEKVAKRIISGELHDCSLSMKVLEYEALLSVSPSYADFILCEINKNYSRMIEFGSSTVWETAKGAEDFYGAGSLCHGWSSIPIYIYEKLGLVNKNIPDKEDLKAVTESKKGIREGDE